MTEHPSNMTQGDAVNHPQHYTSHPSGIECIDVTRWLSFNLGNAVKYVWRAELKNGLEDLRKALWYLDDAMASGASYLSGTAYATTNGLRSAARAEESIHGVGWPRSAFYVAIANGQLNKARAIVIQLIAEAAPQFTADTAEAFIRGIADNEGDGLDLSTLPQVYRRVKGLAHPDRNGGDQSQWDRVEAAAAALRAAGRLP